MSNDELLAAYMKHTADAQHSLRNDIRSIQERTETQEHRIDRRFEPLEIRIDKRLDVLPTTTDKRLDAPGSVC